MLIVRANNTDAVGLNVSDGQEWQISQRPRRVVRIGFTGAAVTTGTFALYYGTERVIECTTNNATAANALVNPYLFWHTSRLICPAGVPINVVVGEAFGASGYLVLDIQEL